ncbi:glycosyl transferase [Microbacterium chocolatum]|uniref:glycosyl transferase n=1 Tax=Microbacterium aurantiacum TaxID=162393 RepID=UPI00338DEB01
MRFVWAVAAFVLAALMIGAGIAQRTVFQGPTTQSAGAEIDDVAPYVLIDGAVMNMYPGAQTLRASGQGEVFAGYGRTTDMQAWLSDTTYTAVTVGDEGMLVTTEVEPAVVEQTTGSEATEPEGTAGTTDEGAGETEAPAAPSSRDPRGSDLWLAEYEQSDDVVLPLQIPEDLSVLLATDGDSAAPSGISVTWPITNRTPWAGPLIVGGAVVMAIGVWLYFLAIRHVRRSKGPRRKGLPVPVTEPIDLSVSASRKGVVSAGGVRRALSRGRRSMLAVPALGVSALLLAGCSADAWPQLGASPTPTPTQTVIAPEGQQQPAVTRDQAETIVARVAETVQEADEALDLDLAATRLDGAMLAARETNYALRGAIADYPAPAPIVSGELEIILPQAFDGWPRSFLAVADDESSNTSSIMVLTQTDPWSDFVLSYAGSLEASTLMPDLAPTYVGAPQVQPDSPFLVMPPEDVAAAYADVINNGQESEFFEMFEEEGDQLRASIASDRARRLDEFNQTAASTGSLTFTSTEGEFTPYALATLESGAIVAVSVRESDEVRPTNEDAVIKLDNNATVQTLAGVDQSATGFETTFSDQIFFYVPGQGSSERIRLLGYASDILEAKVIP